MGARSTTRLATILVALALTAAGCGKDDNPPDVSSKTSPTATATPASSPIPELDAPLAQRMPKVQQAADVLPEPASSNLGDARVSRAAFDSAQAMWETEFQAAGESYAPAHLIFFHTEVHTPCGVQGASTGPFYCPAAAGVYLNTDFFDALARQYRLHSGFAAGYITAHEVAHHVQKLLGVHARVAASNDKDPSGENARSIGVELQADCYAGVWLHTVSSRGELTPADVADILKAAKVVGDDFRRNAAGKDLAPETWTHGSSADRQKWLTIGIEQGSPAACNTFSDG